LTLKEKKIRKDILFHQNFYLHVMFAAKLFQTWDSIFGEPGNASDWK